MPLNCHTVFFRSSLWVEGVSSSDLEFIVDIYCRMSTPVSFFFKKKIV